MNLNLNYWLGRAASRAGLKITPDFKWPSGNVNLLELAIKAQGIKFSAMQVGAYDGKQNDPLESSLHRCSCAVLVEPQEEAAQLLNAKYANVSHVHVLQVAIGPSFGNAKLYRNSKCSPKASLDKNHHKRFALNSQHLETLVVDVWTPQMVYDRYFGSTAPDIVQIDVEGLDDLIVSEVLACDTHPSVINYEVLHLNRARRSNTRELLASHGYRFIDWGWDTLALLADE